MMYNNMQSYVRTGSNGFSSASRIVIAIFLFVFLVLTILLYFFAFPSWQLRLTGVQATAIAHEDGICASDDDSNDSYAFSYSFNGPQGKSYSVTHNSFCTNVINDGDQVAIWYAPDNPTNVLAMPEAILLYIFSGIGGAIDLACLLAILLTLTSGLRARRRRETFSYTNMGLR